jgi:hypothetical protein
MLFSLVFCLLYSSSLEAQVFIPETRYKLNFSSPAGNCFSFYAAGKYGLLDKNMQQILPAIYDKVEATGPYIKMIQGNETWIFDADGNKLSAKSITGAVGLHLAGEYFLYKSDKSSSQTGIVHLSGKVVATPEYYIIEYLGDKYCKYRKGIGMDWGVISLDGEFVLGDSLPIIEGYGDGLVAARQKASNKMGYINVKTRQWEIAPQFPNAYVFEGGVARVNDNGLYNAVSGLNLPLNWRWGLIDKSGEFILDYTYSNFYPFGQSSVSPVVVFETNYAGYQVQKMGAADKKGKLVIPAVYDVVERFSGGYAVVKNNGLFGLIDSAGKVVQPLEYASIVPVADGMHICKKGNKYGAITANGKLAVPFLYDDAISFRQGVSWMKKGALYYLVDQKGTELTLPGYSVIPKTVYTPDAIYIEVKASHILLNKKGEKIFELPYDQAGNIKEGVITVKNGSYFGFVDINGKEIAVPGMFAVVDFREGIGGVQATNTSIPFFIDKSGNKLFNAGNYNFYGPFAEGLAKAFVNIAEWYSYYPDYRLGYIDTRGNVKFTTTFSNGGNFKNGFAVVVNYGSKDSLQGLIDTTGKVIFPTQYYTIGEMSTDGLIALQSKDLKWGFGDINGKVVIPLEYEDAGDFLSGISLVRSNGKVGIIDRNNKKVVDFIYDHAQVMNNPEFIVVKMGDLWGAIDRKGSVVADFKYEYLANMQDGVVWAKLNGKWGLLDNKKIWKEVSNIKDAFGFSGGLCVAVNKEGLYGVIDKAGKTVIPFAYDDMGDFYNGVIVAKISAGLRRVDLK